MARPPEALISGLAVHPSEVGTAYALFSRYGHARLLETRDYGDTWADLSGIDATGTSSNGLPDIAVTTCSLSQMTRISCGWGQTLA